MAMHSATLGGAAMAAKVETMEERLTPMVLNLVPTEGQTITLPATTRKEIFVNLKPTTNLLALTINLPTNAVDEGQRCFVGSTRQIDSCVLKAAGLTVNNAALMFSVGDNAAFVRNEQSTWSRVLTS